MYKNRIFEIIETAQKDDKVSKVFDLFIIVLICLNVLAIILESYNELYSSYKNIFRSFEMISVIIFTIEYLLRLYTSDLKYTKNSRIASLVIYIISPMAIIDLFAILPFYLPFLISIDLRFLRVLRLFRIFRIFKLNRYSKAMNIIIKILKKSLDELIATVFIMFVLILISSTLMFYSESSVQPDAYPNIVSTFWWAICTLTTVGYGDVYPITGLGKVLASIISILGIGLVALPTGIISSEFIKELQGNKKDLLCPHCGKKIENI